MKGVTTIWLNDFPANKLSIEEKEITESDQVQGGGLLEIINYIISEQIRLGKGSPLDNFIQALGIFHYKPEDSLNEFADTKYCSKVLRDVLGDVIVGIEAEARFIVATVFKHLQKLEFLKNEDEILIILEQGGWTEKEIANPTAIAEQILTKEMKKLSNGAEILGLTSDYVESYFQTKAQNISAFTLEHAEDFFKSKELSGKKFKAIANSLGASNKELQQLMKYRTTGNTKGIELFLVNKRVTNGTTDAVLKRMYQSNKELKSFIGTNTKAVKDLVRKSGYAKKFMKFAFKNVNTLGYVDSLISLESAYEPEKMMDNMLTAAGTLISASAGFGVSALLAIGNDHWDRFEEDMFEVIYNSCGISWSDLCDVDDDGKFETPQFCRLFLHYKKEEHILFSNKKIVPTSIRILDTSVAGDVFGFEPKYVNYFLYEDRELSEVCCTRYQN
ncbi:hypothetical protein QUH73_12610 [Labilibaculum sp. K2S]|uniref:hypothetical protein n=1 Tax=Labilibaculum sp. K2S TaxID=3056386 RepID=UPI0025A3F351|nr:hypothetical protein [Labilibaculum sp. K2S]MDM8160660.1 hypothetical protein [Labilibaculum sp. K2S]